MIFNNIFYSLNSYILYLIYILFEKLQFILLIRKSYSFTKADVFISSFSYVVQENLSSFVEVL